MADSKVKILEELKDASGNRYQKYQDSSGKTKYRSVNSKNAYVFSSLEKFEAAKKKIKKESQKKLDLERKQYEKDLVEYNKKEKASLEAIRKKKAENDKRKAELKKKTVNPDLIKLNEFLNEILLVSDDLGKKSNDFYEKYVKFINTTDLVAVGKKYLTLSKNFENLDKKFAELYKSVSKAKVVTKANEEVFDKLVASIENLEKQENNLKVEEQAVKKKSSNKTKSRQQKLNERLDKQNQKSKVKNEKEEEKRRLDIQKRWDERKTSRMKDEEQSKLEALAEEKRRRLGKREKLDKFFSGENFLAKGVKGTGGLIGATVGGPLAALGFDFAEERQFLSQLFSPATHLAKFGVSKIKSLAEKSMGIDDQTLDSLDDVYSPKGAGLRKKVDLNKVSQKLNQVGKNPKDKMFNGFKGVKENFGKMGNLFTNSISNIFNRNNSNAKTNSIQNNLGGSNQTVNQSKIDYNRADEHLGETNLKPTNELLEKILKELKGEEAEKKPGIFSKMLSAIGSLPKFIVPGLLVAGAFSKANKWLDKKFPNKVRDADLEHVDKEYRNNLKENHPTANKLLDKFENWIYPKSEMNKFNSTNVKNIISDSLSTKNNTSLLNSSLIKAEVKKIQKIKDDETNNRDLLEDLKKFFTTDFLDSFVEKMATLMFTSKGSSGRGMPSAQPF